MTTKLTVGALKDRLSAAPDVTRQRMYFAATLREEAGTPVDDFFVVGGSAIEIYTVGEYTSGDIDLVSIDSRRIAAVLRSWGFQSHARIWENPELQIVIDLVKGPYNGSAERTTLATTPFGPVRLAAVEDLLVKRLASYKHWKVKGDFEHALFLGMQFSETIDWDYAKKFAADHDVAELLLSVREAARRRASRGSR